MYNYKEMVVTFVKTAQKNSVKNHQFISKLNNKKVRTNTRFHRLKNELSCLYCQELPVHGQINKVNLEVK